MSRSRRCAPHATATFVLCFILLILFLRDGDVCFSEMKRGLNVCATVLVPTLFPFMIISEMLVRANLGHYLGKVSERAMRRIFGVSGSGAGALLLGIICGFPIGAKTAAALYKRGELSKDECERLLAFCNYPSAPFVVFAVGKTLLGNTSLGVFIYAVNVAAGLILGAFSRAQAHTAQPLGALPEKRRGQPIFSIFTDSVSSAANAVISVCALVTFFTCAVGCISAFDLVNNHPTVKALLFSFFELTSGVAACATLSRRAPAAILSAAAVGWSGLSVLMQIYSSSATEGGSPSLLPYVNSRLISSALCAASTAVAIRVFPSLLPQNIPDADVFLSLSAIPSDLTAVINFLFILSVLICSNKKLDRRRRI